MHFNGVHEWFERTALAHPQRIAICSGETALSYLEVRQRAAGISSGITSCGLSRGDVCALMSTTPHDLVTGVIGLMNAGVVVMPLDVDTPDARIARLLQQARAKALVCDATLAARIQHLIPPHVLLLDSATFGASPPYRTSRSPSPDEPCYVFFTSGSTGEPKGILGRSKSVGHFIGWEVATFGVCQDDVVSLLSSPGSDAILRDIFTPLCAGARIAAPADRFVARDGKLLADWLAASGVTVLHTVPSVLRRLLAAPHVSLPRIRTVLVAGEVLLHSDVILWFERFGADVELINMYGPSETTMIKLFHRVRREDLRRGRIPIGTPIDGCRAIVLDDDLHPVEPGCVGEICLRTPYRSLGYLHRPELTRASFIENPFSDDPHDLVYRTGDQGRLLDDGVMEFVGRRDRQIKIRGVRVEPAEIESALRLHPDVLDVTVVPRESGRDEQELCAYVVMRGDPDFNALRDYLAERFPDPLIPTRYASLDRIPRTLSGKLDVAALTRFEHEPDPRTNTPPRTPLESRIASIWSDLLELDSVGVTDSFFIVGGHSLLAMQILSRVEAAFSIQMSLNQFLLRPTIEAMAMQVQEALLSASPIDTELQMFMDDLSAATLRADR